MKADYWVPSWAWKMADCLAVKKAAKKDGCSVQSWVAKTALCLEWSWVLMKDRGLSMALNWAEKMAVMMAATLAGGGFVC